MLRFLFCLALMVLSGSHAFAPSPAFSTRGARVASSLLPAATSSDGGNVKEVVARRLIVKGNVQGGYYRSCVKNEVSVLTWCASIYYVYSPESAVLSTKC
jgi:hypothetical protein